MTSNDEDDEDHEWEMLRRAVERLEKSIAELGEIIDE